MVLDDVPLPTIKMECLITGDNITYTSFPHASLPLKIVMFSSDLKRKNTVH